MPFDYLNGVRTVEGSVSASAHLASESNKAPLHSQCTWWALAERYASLFPPGRRATRPGDRRQPTMRLDENQPRLLVEAMRGFEPDREDNRILWFHWPGCEFRQT